MHERRDHLAVVLDPRHGPPRVVSGQLDGTAVAVDEAAAGQRQRQLQRRVVERPRERVAQARGRRVLELDHEVAHGAAREARSQQAPDERERQRHHGDHLPPEEVVVGERPIDELEDALEYGAQRDGDGGDEQGREHAARAGRRRHEPPHDHEQQQRREHAEEEDHLGLLQQLDRPCALGDPDQVVVRARLQLREVRTAVVEQQRGQRQRDHRRVAGEHDPAVEPPADAAGRIGEHGVADERVTEVAEQEEQREEQRVVGVAQLPREPEDAGADEQRAEHVRRPPHPCEHADRHERPADRDLGDRALVRREQVVHLHPVRRDAEEGTADDHPEPPHVAIVTHAVGPFPRGRPRSPGRG